ncbi:MAG: cytochrome C, partial [Burkholderiaceae bacterium]
RHFGSDASLEPAVHADLSKWLEANAASFRRVKREMTAPPEGRITLSSWFVREHHDVSAAVWKRKSVGSASNCVACHAGSAQGRFSDHDVRIPK